MNIIKSAVSFSPIAKQFVTRKIGCMSSAEELVHSPKDVMPFATKLRLSVIELRPFKIKFLLSVKEFSPCSKEVRTAFIEWRLAEIAYILLPVALVSTAIEHSPIKRAQRRFLVEFIPLREGAGL